MIDKSNCRARVQRPETQSGLPAHFQNVLQMVLVAVLFLSQPVMATTIPVTELSANKFQPYDKIESSACNYLYLNSAGHLLYYGTSKDCQRRSGEHLNAMLVAEEVMRYAEDQTGNRAADKSLRATMIEWTKKIVDGKVVGNGTSDTCLGINSRTSIGKNGEISSDLKFFYLPLKNAANALAVEQCVLQTVVGFCNRKGQGSTSPSSGDFFATLHNCGAY
jgi:hypothetical protein